MQAGGPVSFNTLGRFSSPVLHQEQVTNCGAAELTQVLEVPQGPPTGIVTALTKFVLFFQTLTRASNTHALWTILQLWSAHLPFPPLCCQKKSLLLSLFGLHTFTNWLGSLTQYLFGVLGLCCLWSVIREERASSWHTAFHFGFLLCSSGRLIASIIFAAKILNIYFEFILCTLSGFVSILCLGWVCSVTGTAVPSGGYWIGHSKRRALSALEL